MVDFDHDRSARIANGGPRSRARRGPPEPATYGVIAGPAGRFAAWALTDSGRMIWTTWRATYARARGELVRKAARRGVTLRWFDGEANV